MEKLYSEIVGTPIVEEDENFAVARVQNLLIDPETSQVIAFFIDTQGKRMINPMDVRGWQNEMIIQNENRIIETEDVIRVKEVMQKACLIVKNRVKTKNGRYLGKVFDCLINTDTMTMEKIYVAKSILGIIHLDSRILSAKNIINITPEWILVKNLDGEEKESIVEKASMPAMT